MASTKQPTPRQLAYLDELKTRLRELRMRQVTFMEQTAQILSQMSSATMEEAQAAAAAAASVAAKSSSLSFKSSDTTSSVAGAGSGGRLNIKQLIQRFEDLRKNSQELDLPEVPEELIKVDVRRILKGYEKLIENGNVLQQSWILLKKTTESCARIADAKAKAKTIAPTEDAPPVKMATVTGSIDVVTVSTVPPPEPSPQIVRINSSKSLGSSTEIVIKELEVFGPEEISPEPDIKYQYKAQDYGRARWGALMQLILRLPNLFRHCKKIKKVIPRACSEGCHLPQKMPTH
ncbi:uncharacterized protein [Drosophila bipectinata]|uniref:uncharacterized protein isoform X2 n=1 Tax=Drosophila bipectinata TaxID=42026 RepID=UPI001C88E681|nr:uncharacterized protein LOC108125321 isoform X2 [Drosophila bipectinata]